MVLYSLPTELFGTGEHGGLVVSEHGVPARGEHGGAHLIPIDAGEERMGLKLSNAITSHSLVWIAD